MYIVLARDMRLGADIKDWFDSRRFGLVRVVPLNDKTVLGSLLAHPTAVLIAARRPDHVLLRSCREAGALAETNGAPVIVVLEESDERARIAILDAGADAVVPFDVRLVTWRVLSMCGYTADPSNPAGLRASTTPGGSFVIVDGHRVALTALEAALLNTLVLHTDRVVGRAQLEQHLWGSVESRTLDVHVARLRRKLGDLGSRIETVRKVGYRYATGAPARTTHG